MWMSVSNQPYWSLCMRLSVEMEHSSHHGQSLKVTTTLMISYCWHSEDNCEKYWNKTDKIIKEYMNGLCWTGSHSRGVSGKSFTATTRWFITLYQYITGLIVSWLLGALSRVLRWESQFLSVSLDRSLNRQLHSVTTASGTVLLHCLSSWRLGKHISLWQTALIVSFFLFCLCILRWSFS